MGDEATPSKGPVLVPVDFSPTSREALVLACRIASCFGAGLLVLHVVHDPGDAPGFYVQGDDDKVLLPLADRAALMLKRFLEEVPHLCITPESRVVEGLPVNRIIEVAGEAGASMIVMGGDVRSGIDRFFLGSMAEEVVHKATIPVTVVKGSAG